MEQEEKKVRPPGYYRVQWNDNLWTIEEWKGWYWAHFKGHELFLKHVDETPVSAEPIPIPDAAVLRSALEKIADILTPAIRIELSHHDMMKRLHTIAREALSQTGDGLASLRWVNASERLPEVIHTPMLGGGLDKGSNRIHFKWEGEAYAGRYVEEKFSIRNVFASAELDRIIPSSEFHNVIWLEDNMLPSPPQPINP